MAHQRLEGISLLRGISIVFVVLIHFLAGLPLHLFSEHTGQPFFVFLDQFGRIAVPVFLAASGYLLEKKYTAPNATLPVISFWRHRLEQILPLYFLWSFLLLGLRLLVPAWNIPELEVSLVSIGRVLLFGQGDYHLYFVPLLVQLYILYPLFHAIFRRFPFVFLLFTALIQGVLFVFIEQHTSTQSLPRFFQSDGQQYLLFCNWWFYFVLGMFLAHDKKPVRALGPLWAVLALASGIFTTSEALYQIHSGRDPLFALRFTRLPIIVYTSSFLLFAWSYLDRLPSLFPTFLRQRLAWLGDHSFLVYLSHTLILRLLLGLWFEQITLFTFAWASGATAVALIISLHTPSHKRLKRARKEKR